MSKCQRIRHLIGPYLYDDVSENERAAVESHLQQCDACRAEVAALRGLISAIPSDTMRADTTAKARTVYALQARIADERVQRRRWRRWRETVLATALAAGAALFFNLWTTYRPAQIVSPPAPASRDDVASQPGPSNISESSLLGARRSPRAVPSQPHHPKRVNRRGGPATTLAEATEAADRGHRAEAGAPPLAPGGEGVGPPPAESHDKSGRSPGKRESAPPALVEVAMAMPVSVAAPAVTGVDDVSQALAAAEQE